VIRILSLNAGLLRRFAGLLEPAPAVMARLVALPEALREHDADLIALQEVYDGKHQAFLIRALRASYPFAVISPARHWIGLGDGLLFLSRCALDVSFCPFSAGPVEERWLARKGVLGVTLRAPERLRVLNVHTSAGGLFRHPESARMDALRERQILQLLGVAAERRDVPVAIVGDLNAGPGVSDANYRLFERHGYTDVYARLHPAGEEPTWDPRNPLNVGGPHRACPPQRIDHAFVRRADLEGGVVLPRRCEVVLGEKCVQQANRRRVPVSDHSGLLVELELPSASPVGSNRA
jgi:endonuclease/exonuclease/phosphatase family metal-dependent hydrolase